MYWFRTSTIVQGVVYGQKWTPYCCCTSGEVFMVLIGINCNTIMSTVWAPTTKLYTIMTNIHWLEYKIGEHILVIGTHLVFNAVGALRFVLLYWQMLRNMTGLQILLCFTNLLWAQGSSNYTIFPTNEKCQSEPLDVCTADIGTQQECLCSGKVYYKNIFNCTRVFKNLFVFKIGH